MKIDAEVEFIAPVASLLETKNATVQVDIDYVDTDDETDIYEYVANELYTIFGRSFSRDEFTITNMEDILEDMILEDMREMILDI